MQHFCLWKIDFILLALLASGNLFAKIRILDASYKLCTMDQISVMECIKFISNEGTVATTILLLTWYSVLFPMYPCFMDSSWSPKLDRWLCMFDLEAKLIICHLFLVSPTEFTQVSHVELFCLAFIFYLTFTADEMSHCWENHQDVSMSLSVGDSYETLNSSVSHISLCCESPARLL